MLLDYQKHSSENYINIMSPCCNTIICKNVDNAQYTDQKLPQATEAILCSQLVF